ncbi:MAG: DUF1573 domain-containing protein, partial [Candidatus Zixiibacteriota bacterium]
KSSCECTEPSVKVEFLAAGESSPLTVSYNTKNFYGPQSRFVEIHTSDPHTPQRIFQFRAIVGGRPAEVDMRPRSVFNLPGSGIDTIKIKNYADRRLDFAIVFQDTSLFHLDVPVKFVAPGGYAEIYLLPREDLSRGVYFSTVTLEFSANPPVRVSTPVKLVRY